MIRPLYTGAAAALLALSVPGLAGAAEGWTNTSGGVQQSQRSASDRPVVTDQLKWRPVRGSAAAKSRTNSEIQLTAGESSSARFSATGSNRYSSGSADRFQSSGPAARTAQSESRLKLGGQDPFEAEPPATAPQFTAPKESVEPAADDAFPPDGTAPKKDPFGDDHAAETQPKTPFDAPEAETEQPMPRKIPTRPIPESVKKAPLKAPGSGNDEANAEVDKLDCEAGRRIVQAGGLDRISLNVHEQGRSGKDFPDECPLWDEQFMDRCYAETTYMWKASALCHKPLYFEDVQLERYGHEWGPLIQPVVSAAHFFGTIPILPYKMGLETPDECIYALGYYRPNSCAPYMIEPIGFTWRAALFEAGAAVGTVAILP